MARIAIGLGIFFDNGRIKGLHNASLHRDFAQPSALQHIAHHIIGTHFSGDFGDDFFRIGAPEAHFDEGIFFHKGIGNGPERLIDDDA
jgi:hypothetical protein